MGNIYRQDSQQLHQLLERASAPGGATIPIPDLQRPFVWTPNQVTLLLDSLIRGWPFGTLLLWKVRHQELAAIPFRPFWTVIDRTSQANGGQLGQMNPPAEYHMVLDGQQRIQSLVLALGGDDWGFTLEDRDWSEEVKDQRPRGRQGKYKHWSKASLCFDLDVFYDEYSKQGNGLLAVDFSKVLRWAVTDPQGGQSNFPRQESHPDPLPRAFDPENRTRLIRLSRLWREAQPNPALKEAQFRQILRPLLEEHSIPEQKRERVLQPMGELMTTLRDVKLSDVTFLELQPFDPQTWTRDTYNDAIVSIFTRLNTAGRTLTREEITFAWLKVGWQPQFTGGRSAVDCFSELREQLEKDGLDLDIDELVSAASFVWSVSDRGGMPLTNSDLLKGDVIRPMAKDLSRRWISIQESFSAGANFVVQRGLEYGPRGHFSSLYALAVLWAWIYVAEAWKADHHVRELELDAFDKRCEESVSKYLDRWLICSQWAGVWSGSSATTIESYAKRLTELLKSVEGLNDGRQVHAAWDQCFKGLVDDLVNTATNGVNSVLASSRERVAVYRNFLWVWHRLDADRWSKSQLPLRVGKRRATCEVDHVVSFALWAGKVQSNSLTPLQDRDEAVALANRMGNCVLLEKNFNISKSDSPLISFLSQIHEIVEGKIRIDAFCAALSIPQTLLDPAAATVKDIVDAIEARDNEIRTELAQFVKGDKARVDVNTPLSGPPVQQSGEFVGDSADVVDGERPDAENDDEELDSAGDDDTEPVPGEADVAGLRATYKEDESVRLIIDHFARRERNQNETHVHRIGVLLARDGIELSRSAIIRAFRRLDVLGVGRFIPGRKGYPSRFEWHMRSLRVREFASSEGVSPASQPASL